ncbi:hypothetical protein BHE74_00038014 [Ensete ventricosum]|nr:hypothetical protein GW17_00060101 [Ensete ventricosum]RWW55359.1 hypothetical protein BHE74_00038014 [Ensete ventricosum]
MATGEEGLRKGDAMTRWGGGGGGRGVVVNDVEVGERRELEKERAVAFEEVVTVAIEESHHRCAWGKTSPLSLDEDIAAVVGGRRHHCCWRKTSLLSLFADGRKSVTVQKHWGKT